MLAALRPGSNPSGPGRILSAWLALLTLALLCPSVAGQLNAPGEDPPEAAPGTPADVGPAPGKAPGKPLKGLGKTPRRVPGKGMGKAGAGKAAGKKPGNPAAKESTKEKGKEAATRANAAWKAVVGPLIDQFYSCRPDIAFRRAWPKARELGLDSCGSSGAVRWHKALTDALAELARITKKSGGPASEQARVLSDWIESEVLLLESQSLATSDPASYVRRALLTLRAVREAHWLSPDARTAKLTFLLGELSTYFHEARICLLAPAPGWIEAALRDIGDLRDLVDELEAELPKKPIKPAPARKGEKPAPVEPTAGETVESFRRWLLEILPGAGGTPPGLIPDEWTRLVQLASGTSWSTSDIKVSCLRELAQLAPAPLESSTRRHVPDADGLALRVESAATHALRMAQAAKLLPKRVKPKDVEFELENGLRGGSGITRLRPGKEALDVLLELPHPSWSARRTGTRYRVFDGPAQQAVLGMRYGLTGEAGLVQATLADRKAPPMLLEQRMLREGYGLYALDWLNRIDWIENPFRTDEGIQETIAQQRGLEAARLTATLELHGENHSFEEALMAFRRRTGMDEDSARVEVLRSQCDPLYGIGYLGLLELRKLEQRIAAISGPRKGTRITLLLVQRHPELRPSDLVAAVGAKRALREGTSGAALEIPGRSQKELTRSR